MKKKDLLDLYSEYLLSSFGPATATGLSRMMDGEISHDQVTRFLAETGKQSADLWMIAKPHVRKIQSEDGVLIEDDSIEEKPYTDENDIICWHYDYSKGRQVKGVNFMTALYQSKGVILPVGFQLVAKTEHYVDKKTGRESRRSPVEKNEYCRRLIEQAVKNQVPFRYVLFDVWYASAQNMIFIKHEARRDFICPIKTNRKVALSVEGQHHGQYHRVDTLELEENTVRGIYLEGVDFPLELVKQTFVNEDGSTGVLYLVTSDTTLSYHEITMIYRKRWSVEYYHKSLKQNVSLEKSPAKTVTTQTNHFFAALCGFIKLEMLKINTKLNHFALKTKLYMNALHTAFLSLQQLNPVQLTA